MKTDMMPAADARNPVRATRRSLPRASMTERSFKDRTGNTQGMRLRINPPSSPAINAPDKSPAPALVGRTWNSAARAPSINVKVKGEPGGGETFPSAGFTRTVAVRPSAEIAKEGAAKETGGTLSTNKSGAEKGRVDATTTDRTPSSHAASRDDRPDALPSSGRAARATAIVSAATPGRAGPEGISSRSETLSGTQMSEQSERSARRRTTATSPGRSSETVIGRTTVPS